MTRLCAGQCRWRQAPWAFFGAGRRLGLAAIAAGGIPGERIATVLTGSNVHPELAAELLAEEARRIAT